MKLTRVLGTRADVGNRAVRSKDAVNRDQFSTDAGNSRAGNNRAGSNRTRKTRSKDITYVNHMQGCCRNKIFCTDRMLNYIRTSFFIEFMHPFNFSYLYSLKSCLQYFPFYKMQTTLYKRSSRCPQPLKNKHQKIQNIKGIRKN